MKPAVVLLSGGVDSATTLAIARNQGFLPYGLSFAYGAGRASTKVPTSGSPRAVQEAAWRALNTPFAHDYSVVNESPP